MDANEKAIVPPPGGTDRREFWLRKEDRNLGMAKTFDQLGLLEYDAIEAFVRWREMSWE